MLKGISPLLSPELVKILMEMGHGDTLVIADANFPSASCGQRVVRADGLGAAEIMDAVLSLMPLDSYVESAVSLMQLNPGDDYVPFIWDDFKKVVAAREGEQNIRFIDRFEFYKQTKEAYCVIATGETALYACAILKKGVVKP